MFKIISALILTLALSPAYAQTLTDGQISKVLMTINEGEVDLAKKAKGDAQNEDVKIFAMKMIEHHKENMKETKKVSKDNDIKEKDSDLSKNLKEEAKLTKKDLKKKDKASFDKTYMIQQVTLHEKALRTLDTMLIPNAVDPEFKAHLQKTREAVAAHLEEARTLNTKIQ